MKDPSEISVIEHLRRVSKIKIVDGGNIPFLLVRRKKSAVSEGISPINDSDNQSDTQKSAQKVTSR